MRKENYKDYFKSKKITIMGLGLLGRGVGVAKFLAETGAILTITDLKSRKELKSSLDELRKYKDIHYTLGKHDLKDFANKDMIIKAAGVPKDSIYIKEAYKNQIPIEMDASLFAKLADEIKVIGVTGTRGKSMTTALIYEILSKSGKYKNKTYIGGNVRGMATLPLLKKIKKSLPAGRQGDIVVLELDSWQLQGFGESKISPHIAVFTSFMQDHMNYYKDSMTDYFNDKVNIFKFQKEGDTLIIRPDVKQRIFPYRRPINPRTAKTDHEVNSKLIIINPNDVADFDFIVPGEHQRENLACAVAVALELGVSMSEIKKTVKEFKGLEGRLQLVKTINDVKIYNDNNATTPEATGAGIVALSKVSYSEKPKIIIICGGADKRLSLHHLVKTANKNCKAIVTIPGEGTDRLLEFKFRPEIHKTKNLKEAVKTALGLASRGDIILFSPGFASFGAFKNEYERNDLFMRIINSL